MTPEEKAARIKVLEALLDLECPVYYDGDPDDCICREQGEAAAELLELQGLEE